MALDGLHELVIQLCKGMCSDWLESFRKLHAIMAFKGLAFSQRNTSWLLTSPKAAYQISEQHHINSKKHSIQDGWAAR